MRLLGFTLISFLFTVLFTSALVVSIPYSLTDKLIWLGISVPIIWAGSMIYCYWDDTAWRPVTVLSSLSAFAAAIIVLLPVPS